MSEYKSEIYYFRVYYFSNEKPIFGYWLPLHSESRKSKGALELLLNVLSNGRVTYTGKAGMEVLLLNDETVHNITIHNTAPDYIRIFAYQLIFCAWQTRGSILLKDIPVSFTSKTLELNGRLSNLLYWEQEKIKDSYFLGNFPPEWIKNQKQNITGLYSYFKSNSSGQENKLDFLESLFLRCLLSKQKALKELSDLSLFPVNILGSNIGNESFENIAKRRIPNLSKEFDDSVDIINLLTKPYYHRTIKLTDKSKESLKAGRSLVKETEPSTYEEKETGYCQSCENNPCICSDPSYSTIDEINILN